MGEKDRGESGGGVGEKDGEGGRGGVGGGDGEGEGEEKREHVKFNLIPVELMVVDSLGGDG